jgi:hypothetical protein
VKRRDFLKVSALATASLAFAGGGSVPNVPEEGTILDFAESRGIPLYPVQRVVLKAIYGIPLDDTEKFPLRWHWNRSAEDGSPLTTEVTEAQYLQWLYEQGRSNIREVLPGAEMHECVLLLGRRGGSTELTSLIEAYEVRRLLTHRSPQRYYGFPDGNEIGLAHVSGNPDSVEWSIEMTREYLSTGDLSGFQAHNQKKRLSFQTVVDIEQTGRFGKQGARASIHLKGFSWRSKAVRGGGNKVVVLDQAMHYPKDYARMVYQALYPSMVAFTRGREMTSELESKMIMVSAGRRFKNRDAARGNYVFQRAGEIWRGVENRFDRRSLLLQIPTWELNPSISLEGFFESGTDTFNEKFGAQMSWESGVSQWNKTVLR